MGTDTSTIRGDSSMLEVLRILVLVQGAIFVTTAVESLAAIAFGGPALIPLVALNGSLALIVLLSARGLRRGSRKARRTVVITEVLVMLMFALDSLISLFITQGGLGLVPTLTRFVLPTTIIWTINRRIVRPHFAKDLPEAPAPPEPPVLPPPPAEYQPELVGSSV